MSTRMMAAQRTTWKESELNDIRRFGDALIRTEDLDPVYSGLYRARLPKPQLERALIAYWCFYHLGFAAWASEEDGDRFWNRMGVAAANTEPSRVGARWPRATERRHFRGQMCVDAIKWFSRREPEHWVRSLVDCETEKEVMKEVTQWPLFGPWIAFKAADMLERVYGQPLKFDPNIGLLYDSPRKTLDLLVESKEWVLDIERTPEAIYYALLQIFRAKKAPPAKDRYCNAQEVETILCKFGSMKSGHYRVGKDITEVRHALNGWGETAQTIHNAMPDEVELV